MHKVKGNGDFWATLELETTSNLSYKPFKSSTQGNISKIKLKAPSVDCVTR